jgi:cytochrome c biogenesis protein CcmG/thiol:disulfide interchange protein DsbE
MTTRQQWGIVGAIVALLALGLWVATRVLGSELFPVTVGSPAPDFAAKTLVGAPRTKTLADYEGEVVLLNIWATWCVPCRVEMPSMQALHQALGPQGLKIVAVSVDDPGSEDAIREFATEYGLTFEILHDASGRIRQQYQTTGVPETFVIGRDGVIRRKVIAAANWNSPDNRKLLAQLLGVPVPAAPDSTLVPKDEAPRTSGAAGDRGTPTGAAAGVAAR